MSYQRDREQFYMTAGKIGLSQHTADRLLRYASALQRLAVAQCNGDWPYDEHNMGKFRKYYTCERCEARTAVRCNSRTINVGRKSATTGRESVKPQRICPDCRTAELVRAVLAEHNRIAMGREAETLCWEARIEGDPRSYVLRLVPRGTSDEDYQTGRVRPIYVPGR